VSCLPPARVHSAVSLAAGVELRQAGQRCPAGYARMPMIPAPTRLCYVHRRRHAGGTAASIPSP
jgi:hypothetical protein